MVQSLYDSGVTSMLILVVGVAQIYLMRRKK